VLPHLFGCNPFLSPNKLGVEFGLLGHKLLCHEFVAGDHKDNTARERADEEAKYHAKCGVHIYFYAARSNVAMHIARPFACSLSRHAPCPRVCMAVDSGILIHGWRSGHRNRMPITGVQSMCDSKPSLPPTFTSDGHN
jgi:hypothetical protein